MDVLSLVFTVALTAFIVNIVIASYGVFAKHSLVKKIISIAIFSDSINILAITIGFRALENSYPSPPVLGEKPLSVEDIESFTSIAVDPLPQAFVLTAIVIGLAVTTFLLGLAVIYYRHFGTDDIRASLEEEDDEENI